MFDDGSGPALYVAGRFTLAGGMPVNYIAKWDGSVWSSLGMGADSEVEALGVFDDGSGSALYAGGDFHTAAGPDAIGIARWNGSTWSSVGGGVNGGPFALTVFDDGSGAGLYAAGIFPSAGGTQARQIARWDGTRWSALGHGLNNVAYALAVHDDGLGNGPDLYVGGTFTQAGAITSLHIARWRACSSPISTFCFGDGTVAPCPCSNTGSTGRGCQNSAGTGGAGLSSTGTPSPDTVVFHVSGEISTVLTIFLQGNSLISATTRFGDGLRCAGGSLKRLYVKTALGGSADAPQAGDPSVTTRSAALGDPILPGSTRYYQTYYRDNASYCTTNNFSSSNGVRIVW